VDFTTKFAKQNSIISRARLPRRFAPRNDSWRVNL